MPTTVDNLQINRKRTVANCLDYLNKHDLNFLHSAIEEPAALCIRRSPREYELP